MKFIKKHKIYFISFILITLIFFIPVILLHITPFGKDNLLTRDLMYQIYPFFLDLKNSLFHNELLYSWHGGFGIPYYRIFFNYLSSPVNIFVLFFNNKNVVDYFTFLLYFKLLLIGGSITFYLKKKFNTDNLILLIPILLYTFSGYFINMYFIVQWLDMLIFLPLLTYSIELLIDKHKIYPYIFILFLIMFINYYIGYMLCIYTAIYFFAYSIYKSKGITIKEKINNISKDFLIILGSTSIFILLSSFILIPNMFSFSSFGSLDGIASIREYEFTIIDMIISHLPFVNYQVNMYYYGNPPVLYGGILSILLLIPFIFNKRINKRFRILYISLSFIFILVFRIPALDSIFNFFHSPNGLPYRYSFMYIFLLTIICSKMLLMPYKRYHIFISTVILEGLLTYLLIKGNYYYLDNKFIIINMIAIGIYSLLYLFKNDKIKYVFIVLCCIELSSYLYLSINKNYVDSKYTRYSIEDKELYDKYHDYRYRMETNIQFNEKDDYRIHTYPSYKYGYNSTSVFSSTSYGSLSEFVAKLGAYSNGTTIINYLYNTPIYNSIFGIKYLIDYDTDDTYYDKEDRVSTYKYPFELIYGINKNDFKIGNDILNNQNDLVKSFSGIENVLEPIKYKKELVYEDDNIKVYDYKYKGDAFFYYTNSNIALIYDSKYMYSHLSIKKELIDLLDINNLLEETTSYICLRHTNDNKITVVFTKDADEDGVVLFKTNKDKFKEFYEYMSKYQAKIDNIDSKGIKGSITLDNNMQVFTSIPYDKGWHAYVDGKEVKTSSLYNIFLTFDMDEGTHDFELKYKIPYIEETLLISILTFVTLMGVYFYFKGVK